jgi:hypothetical protein
MSITINPNWGAHAPNGSSFARSWHVLVRVGLATIAVAATTGLQLPVEVNFPGQPFLLYFVAVVASANALGRTAGFVTVALHRCFSTILPTH